jgi:hypothetical protein
MYTSTNEEPAGTFTFHTVVMFPVAVDGCQNQRNGMEIGAGGRGMRRGGEKGHKKERTRRTGGSR